ncbi:hypothetical protein FSP39_005922 [Pinctada imbricata]|uniref:L-Fucosyltransferase n=1 Tax=Pinctada imbricata TaxID=66713 RepID=A0AA88YGV5_PINIB|nr:hypothetical protein FSP39_005922 [Pinctada imbricata]
MLRNLRNEEIEEETDEISSKLCMNSAVYNPPVACLKYQGRLGNLLFMYAFHYVYSMQKDVAMVKIGQFDLDSVFILEQGKFVTDSQYSTTYCDCLPIIEDRYDCGFDINIANITKGRSVSFLGFFQSWRYWIDYEHKIRGLFTFRSEVRNSAERQFKGMLRYQGWSVERDIFVGVHIRRGDYANKFLINFGQKTAPFSYIKNAMTLMKKIYKTVRYVVFSDDIGWCKQNIKTRKKEIFYVEDNTAAVDMAMMTLTNHSIITAGTFGWWAAFLTDGTTIYYKDLFTRNTSYAEQFPNQEIRDFFPPLWIGLDK